MLVEDPEEVQVSVEGLAYATIQPKIKEELSKDKDSLERLIKALKDAPPKSPLTYGALSIFVNLTR
jgi:protein unc-45